MARRRQASTRMGLLLLAATVHIAGGPSSARAPQAGTAAPANGRIAFGLLHGPCTAEQCNFEIQTIAPTGRGLDRITETPGEERGPTWSPDGRKIAFHLDGHIYAMDADGTGTTKLSTTSARGEYWPSWSPDGRSIAYHGYQITRSPFVTVWVMGADGSEPRQLTDGVGDAAWPTWSPNADRIAYSLGLPSGVVRLYVMDADGSNRTPVAIGLADADFPDWSSTGWIVFQGSVGPGDWDIYKVRPDGSELTQLTNNDIRDTEPAWSPDGRWLVFVRGALTSADLFKMRADGSREVQLTFFGGRVEAPAWQPRPR